jgi:hypothetical protein
LATDCVADLTDVLGERRKKEDLTAEGAEGAEREKGGRLWDL